MLVVQSERAGLLRSSFDEHEPISRLDGIDGSFNGHPHVAPKIIVLCVAIKSGHFAIASEWIVHVSSPQRNPPG